MIQRQSHTTVLVLDQEAALQFYRDILGFKPVIDSPMEDGTRWRTISPPEQPDLQLFLSAVTPGMMFDAETAEQIRDLVAKGSFGISVFETVNCQASYEKLKAKGVTFLQPPAKRPYGIEAIAKGNSGNWFSLHQATN